MTTVRTVIHDRRIEVPAPEDLPDGTEVILSIGTDVADDDGPMSTEEIARVLAAMGRMQPLEIPDDVAAELDAWERKLNQHGIDDADRVPRTLSDETIPPRHRHCCAASRPQAWRIRASRGRGRQGESRRHRCASARRTRVVPKASPQRDRNVLRLTARRSTRGNSGWWTLLPRSSTAVSRSS